MGKYNIVRMVVAVLLLCCATINAHGANDDTLRRAQQLADKGQSAQSLLLVNKLIDNLDRNDNNNQELLMKAYILSGADYKMIGNSDLALKSYRLALKMAEERGDKRIIASVYNNIFAIYIAKGNYEQGEDLLNNALKINIELGDSTNICKNYNNLGLVQYELSKYEQALANMHSALAYCKFDDRQARSLVYTNIAEVYTRQEQYVKAEKELENALRLQKELDFNITMIQTPLNMAYVKAKLGKRAEAQAIQQKICERLKHIESIPEQADALAQMAETDFVLKDSVGGMRKMIEYCQLADSLKAYEKNSQLQQLLVAYNTERLNERNENLRKSVEARTYTIYIGLVFAVFLILALVYLITRIRSDRRKNQLIAKQREQLYAYEQAENERRQKELSLEIDHKNRQLTSYTIDLAASNEFHLKTYEILAEAKANITSNPEVANSKLVETMYNLQHYNDKMVREDFRVYFDEVHPEFLSNLSKRYPQLSQNDLRICAYLHLGMSTKEIAALTFREIRSVESSRNRMRKKLDLPINVSLTEFLRREAQRKS